jgi:haloalkane dehalogenase
MSEPQPDPRRASSDSGEDAEEILRTPDDRFDDLPDYPFDPHYADVDGLRMHYVDEGPREADPVVLLHGEPSWSYLYRTMIPILAEAGHRVVAPDLVGFGKSDKPADRASHTYQRHVDWMRRLLIDELDLSDVTLFVQDWGGLIGLRVLAAHPDRFARVVASNTGLPVGEGLSEAFERWRTFAREVPRFPVGSVVQNGTVTSLSSEVVAAYEAPFPDESYKAGARMLPALVPTEPDDPAAEANRAAWAVLTSWERPFLTLFGDSDPITQGGESVFQKQVPGAEGQSHAIVEDAGHFLQEDRGEYLAERIVDFIAATS